MSGFLAIEGDFSRSLTRDLLEKETIMVNFGKAIALGFRNYVNFSGVSRRSEYWWWVLFVVLLSIVTSLLDGFLFPGHLVQQSTFGSGSDAYATTMQGGGRWISDLVGLALFLPGLSLSIRRLRDAGHAWYNIFWAFLPLVGPIILIVFYCQQSRYGHPQGGSLTETQQAYTRY